jgi:hypothetical protein
MHIVENLGGSQILDQNLRGGHGFLDKIAMGVPYDGFYCIFIGKFFWVLYFIPPHTHCVHLYVRKGRSLLATQLKLSSLLPVCEWSTSLVAPSSSLSSGRSTSSSSLQSNEQSRQSDIGSTEPVVCL